MTTTPRAALLTIVLGRMGCFRWPRVASPVLGGRPHGRVQCQLRLIRERQRLIGSQPTWQGLHKFQLSEPVGHPAPPGLCGRKETRRKELKGQNRPRDKGPTPYSLPLPRPQAGTANQPQHPSLNITQLAKFFPSPFKGEGQPSGLPCHPAAWGCSRVAWPLSGAAGAGGWAGLGPYSLACTQMPAVEQVQCLWAQKTAFDL